MFARQRRIPELGLLGSDHGVELYRLPAWCKHFLRREFETALTVCNWLYAIGKERANAVELPDPMLMNDLPDEIADFFIKPYPETADHPLAGPRIEPIGL